MLKNKLFGVNVHLGAFFYSTEVWPRRIKTWKIWLVRISWPRVVLFFSVRGIIYSDIRRFGVWLRGTSTTFAACWWINAGCEGIMSRRSHCATCPHALAFVSLLPHSHRRCSAVHAKFVPILLSMHIAPPSLHQAELRAKNLPRSPNQPLLSLLGLPSLPLLLQTPNSPNSCHANWSWQTQLIMHR